MNFYFNLGYVFFRFILVILLTNTLRAEVVVWRTNPPDGMLKAELHCERDFPAKNGVLVLCPGMNGDGAILAKDAAWRNFAKEKELGLVGVSFSSPPELLYGEPARGYYYPEQGSGDVLIRGLRELYGNDVKLFLYGFSGGAQFCARFTDQHPKRVMSWAAYAACFWANPVSAAPCSPPGIITCGEFDATRYSPAFGYFQQGRRTGARWSWVSVGGIGHVRYRRLEDFIRAYFDAVMINDFSQALWLDAETMKPMSENELLLAPSLSVWLPTPRVADLWLKLHHP